MTDNWTDKNLESVDFGNFDIINSKNLGLSISLGGEPEDVKRDILLISNNLGTFNPDKEREMVSNLPEIILSADSIISINNLQGIINSFKIGWIENICKETLTSNNITIFNNKNKIPILSTGITILNNKTFMLNAPISIESLNYLISYDNIGRNLNGEFTNIFKIELPVNINIRISNITSIIMENGDKYCINPTNGKQITYRVEY